MDTRTPEQRTRIMRSVRTKDTGPEQKVRKLLHGLGYRYRLHDKRLPGKPDIVFPARRKVIFIHGCFWHGHGCLKGKLPKSRIDYWEPKIAANRSRDFRVAEQLSRAGWRSLTVWQCETSEKQVLSEHLIKFLGVPKKPIDFSPRVSY